MSSSGEYLIVVDESGWLLELGPGVMSVINDKLRCMMMI